MRRWLPAGLAALAAVVAIPGAALAATQIGRETLTGPQTPIHVIPHPIGTHTPVVVTFRQPVNTTSTSSLQTTERLEVAGPMASGCVGQGDVTVPAATAGASMKLTIRPGKLGGPWCLGAYRGTLIVSMMPRCSGTPFHACPEFVVAPRIVGHFSFRVTAQ